MNRSSKQKWPRFFLSAAALAVAAFLPGCGGPGSQGGVSGKVTYKGAKVTGGNITLTNSGGSGAPYTIPIKADGTYSVTSVPPGQYQVAIETDSVKAMSTGLPPGVTPPPGVDPTRPPTAPPGTTPPPGADPSKAGFQPPTGADIPKYVQIPAKYRDPKTSGLTWEIKAGSNPSKDFDLTD